MQAFEFGPFRLDEPGRLLSLDNREVALQPRVFDLLAYLVRHRARVVSKDELLDALWPGVHVTENSLQRAVSALRSALRDGGMDGTLKNYPGKGYRFCEDVSAGEPEAPPAAASTTRATDGLEAHRQAFAEQRWRDAAALYADLDGRRALDGAELEEWGDSLRFIGRPADAIPVLMRAVAAYRKAGENGAAARAAVSLSDIHFERSEPAVARGWLANAHDMLAATPDAAETGYVLWMESKVAANEGEHERARDLADATYNFGQRKGDPALEALGLVFRGFHRVSLGDTAAGLADQDRGAALGVAHDVGVMVGGILYCNILWTCRAVGDWARATQWTFGYRQYTTACRLEFSGSCNLHHAEVLGVRGSLKSALAYIEEALQRLVHDAPWSQGDAYRVLGDLRAAIGNEASAIEAYERSYEFGWSPEPGYAMLLVERGDAEAACASLERSLIGSGWWNVQRRGILLAHLALAAAHAGRATRAEALIAELAGQDGRWPYPSVRALASEASAVLAERRGETEEALRQMQLARQIWAGLESRLHATRLRLKIAALQTKLGDHNGAGIELRAAYAAAQELESDKLIAQCRALQHMPA